MPVENKISIQIPADLLTQVLSLIAQIKNLLLPYLTALTPDEVHSLFKMSDKSIPHVDKCIGYSKTNPEFLPSFVDLPEWEIDFKAFRDLYQLIRPLDEIIDGLTASATLSGSECMTSSLAYYNTVKQAAKTNVPGAQTIFDDLKKRFAKRGTIEEPGQTPAQ